MYCLDGTNFLTKRRCKAIFVRYPASEPPIDLSCQLSLTQQIQWTQMM